MKYSRSCSCVPPVKPLPVMFKQLFILLLFQLASVLIFCIGFFPQKNVLKGNGDFVTEQDFQKQSAPVFDKFVLVVVDALRSDFVFDQTYSNFTFVHTLLNEGSAWGFTAYSNPPTVTLPRLKGITTGSTPNFLDAILNVAEDDSSSNLNDQDSWLSQLHNRGKIMRFFGDDTWLKLFPSEFFQQKDGTNSFFVSDFEQVDYNVTRHISEQLANQDEWDVLILHYLGLDHIGHKGGSRSQFMPAKHREMDLVVKNLYENLGDNTLICLMGDHGMNDVGNHGGSSAGETSAGLVLISKELQKYEPPIKQRGVELPVEGTDLEDYEYLSKIQQVDIVPTLAALLNIPIPKNNVGIIIPDILRLLDPRLAIIKLKDNYHQLTSVLNGGVGNFLEFKYEDIPVIIEKMKDIQVDVTKSATNYNYKYLIAGLVLLALIMLTVVRIGYTTMGFTPSFALLSSISLLIGFSSFGSSFVEEEHQIWWWIVTGLTLISFVSLRNGVLLHLMILTCVRLVRGWNNSGQKNTYENVVSVVLKKHPDAQWYLNLLTIGVVGLQGSTSDPITFVGAFVLSALCLVYKICWSITNRETVPLWMCNIAHASSTHFLTSSNENEDIGAALVPLAQLFFQFFGVIFLARLIGTRIKLFKKNAIGELTRYITVLMIFQSPTSNIGLFLIFHILRHLLTALIETYYRSDIFLVAIISLILQYFTFFHAGGTNAIASVDLSNAYNGVSENYNIYAVGFMMCVSNFAPTIYWSTFSWSFICKSKDKLENSAKFKLVFLLFNCVTGCFLLAACFLLRFHLFIWSVFSPKLCYFATWNIFINLIIIWGAGLLSLI